MVETFVLMPANYRNKAAAMSILVKYSSGLLRVSQQLNVNSKKHTSDGSDLAQNYVSISSDDCK